MKVTIWVEADHVRDKIAYRSVVMLKNVVMTLSKHQALLQSCMYVSEMDATGITTDQSALLLGITILWSSTLLFHL